MAVVWGMLVEGLGAKVVVSGELGEGLGAVEGRSTLGFRQLAC